MGRAVTSKISICWQFQSYTWSKVNILGGSLSSALGLRTCMRLGGQQMQAFDSSIGVPPRLCALVCAILHATCTAAPVLLHLHVDMYLHAMHMSAWAQMLTLTWPASTSMSTMRSLPSFVSLLFKGRQRTTTCEGEEATKSHCNILAPVASVTLVVP